MPDSVQLFREHKNVLIMRTFSKVYGLAGLRVGYGIGDASVLEAMNKLRTPFNLTGVSQAAALAALDDAEHVSRSITENAAERARLTKGLTQLGLRPVPSHANFIFIDIGPEAQELCDELLHEGVIVRPRGWRGFPEAIRVSVGIASENDKLLAVMAACSGSARGKARWPRDEGVAPEWRPAQRRSYFRYPDQIQNHRRGGPVIKSYATKLRRHGIHAGLRLPHHSLESQANRCAGQAELRRARRG